MLSFILFLKHIRFVQYDPLNNFCIQVREVLPFMQCVFVN